MRERSRDVGVAFCCVCLVLMPSVESLTWTAQPSNQTEAIKGVHVSLTWRYSLTADELTKSNTFLLIRWNKFNPSSSTYDQFASRQKIIGQAAAYFEPSAPRIVIDRATGTNFSSLEIDNVRLEDEGSYKIEISVEFPGNVIAAHDVVNLTVSVPPEIVFASNDTDVCEGSNVILSCNATGVPPPSIIWTRVADNGKDSASLPTVDGSYVMNSISRSANGTYRCTARNAGGTVNRTAQVMIRYSASVDRIDTSDSSNIVNEGDSFNMSCEASDNPLPLNYTWIKDNKPEGNDMVLHFNNISRDDAGEYTCDVENRCGKGSRSQAVVVYYKPDDVTLEVNATRNENCSESVWVNFTCRASEANPPVEKYRLYREEVFRENDIGTWIQESFFGEHNYSCSAVYLGQNLRSSNNKMVTVQGIGQNISVDFKNGSSTPEEGDYVSLYCNVSGFPEPSITWSNGSDDVVVAEGRWLNFSNITRDRAGNYSCRSNNSCGKRNSLPRSIDVWFRPENIVLNKDSNSKVCSGVTVTFTCMADANPEVTQYTLYGDNSLIESMGKTGITTRQLNTTGRFTFSCEASNGVGSPGKSIDSNLTVEGVPASVTAVTRIPASDIKEGDNVTLFCNVSGDPLPNVVWVFGENHTRTNDTLWIPSVSRNNSGNYSCHVNNTCGNDSKTILLDVQFGPENVALKANISNSKVCAGVTVTFTCTADANPEVTQYTLFKNDDPAESVKTLKEVPMLLNASGRFKYSCEANNSVGSPRKSSEVNLTVEVPPSSVTIVYDRIENDRIVVNEGENVTLFCNASALSSLNFSWVNSNGASMGASDKWVLLNIRRNQTGQYTCTASNACGAQSKSANISVQYPPFVTENGQTSRTINTTPGKSTTLSCPVDGFPAPNITWYEGNDTSGRERSNGTHWSFEPQSSDAGWYICFAENVLGNVTARFRLLVEERLKSTTQPTTQSTETTHSAELTLEKINGNETEYREEYNDLSNNITKQLTELFEKEMNKTYVNVSNYEKTKVFEYRNGSVIVSFHLFFTTPVTANEAFAKLRSAIVSGTFGPFEVGDLTVVPTPTTSPTKPASAATTEATTEPEHCDESFFKKEDCSVKLAVVVGISVAAVVLIVIAAAAVGYWTHKKRKCLKDTRIAHDPGCEEQRLQGDDPYAQVNNGYAETGPRSVNSREKGAAAVLDYAVVDKSGKKKKKLDEEKPPEYAVVDKSKKTKKNEKGDDTYAKVDMSKKTSKKKRKPGEDTLYADLGDFNGASQMPTVATSPKAQAQLPPIKRPEPYEGTQYADITQFLKGDATLPIDDKQGGQQGAELKEKEGKTDGAGGENAPKETPM